MIKLWAMRLALPFLTHQCVEMQKKLIKIAITATAAETDGLKCLMDMEHPH